MIPHLGSGKHGNVDVFPGYGIFIDRCILITDLTRWNPVFIQVFRHPDHIERMNVEREAQGKSDPVQTAAEDVTQDPVSFRVPLYLFEK